MPSAYIGLGANLGNADATVRQAAAEIAQLRTTSSLRLSPLYRTAPVDSDGPNYVNGVAKVQTTLAALELLRALQAIEQAHGRKRPYRNAPRTLDLDILLFDDLVVDQPELTVPHPRMHERAFVLKPLSDLAPDLCLKQGPLQQLLAACSDQQIARLG